MAKFEMDTDFIRKLAAILEETKLGEIEMADGERQCHETVLHGVQDHLVPAMDGATCRPPLEFRDVLRRALGHHGLQRGELVLADRDGSRTLDLVIGLDEPSLHAGRRRAYLVGSSRRCCERACKSHAGGERCRNRRSPRMLDRMFHGVVSFLPVAVPRVYSWEEAASLPGLPEELIEKPNRQKTER